MQNNNIMEVASVERTNPKATIRHLLADDNLEVAGFGQPINSDTAMDMVTSYYEDCKEITKLIIAIETNPDYLPLKQSTWFASLKRRNNQQTQCVSGVFGKELLLQILAQRNCEGIRYFLGSDYDGYDTVILMGVEHAKNKDNNDTIEPNRKGEKTAKSKLLERTMNNATTFPTDSIPIKGEVHGNSLTISEALAKLNSPGFTGTIYDVIFGTY
jgi:hypothetical protein